MIFILVGYLHVTLQFPENSRHFLTNVMRPSPVSVLFYCHHATNTATVIADSPVTLSETIRSDLLSGQVIDPLRKCTPDN